MTTPIEPMNLSQLMVKDLPVIFLSCGEANAEENFSLLQEADLPHLGRVTGVKGFDAAHKAASKMAQEMVPEATNFVTVDADNTMTRDWFWRVWLEDIQKAIPSPLDVSVVSFRAVNAVNAACYGNGGVKIWSHIFAKNMVTHELTDDKVVDFCWDPNYFQVKNVVSTTCPNGSALQALRAGYREGVKLTLAGKELSPVETRQALSSKHVVPNVRLNQWVTLGFDVPFGVWCCLGTLLGVTDALHSPSLARKVLVDHDAFTALVYNEVLHKRLLNPSIAWSHKDERLDKAIQAVGKNLVQSDVIVSLPFNRQRSSFVKQAILANIAGSSKIERE